MLNPFSPFRLKPKPAPDPNAPIYADPYGRAIAGAINLMLLFYLLRWVFEALTVKLLFLVDPVALDRMPPPQHLSEAVQKFIDTGLMTFWFVNCFVQFCMIGVFWVTCELAFRTTPGKWLMGYKVVRRSNHQQEPSSLQRIARFLAYLPSCAPLMLGLFVAVFSKERRALHDRIAGTVVISTRPRGWYIAQLKKLFGKSSE